MEYNITYLHMTIIGLFPDPIWTLLTLSTSSIREEVMGGVSCSGHTKNWAWVCLHVQLANNISLYQQLKFLSVHTR